MQQHLSAATGEKLLLQRLHPHLHLFDLEKTSNILNTIKQPLDVNNHQ